ncbi:hypothetical protein [Conexibacter sp. CPCC 206217]|uniref:hypothetical protein n=1 Tax=Conexibacter sp. CPCC 206217 TaxID=3064574 RepID=UPI0027210EC1|nr:hypothetical protein [Conexibacter sp. CPCC 206217]MDO8212179.1 hypothetical protein [Conexibacter sp. CPCC 206217]
MIRTKHLAAALAFSFVAAWIGFGFGQAVLCLLAAAVLYTAVAVRAGEIDLAGLQARIVERQPPTPAKRKVM